MKVSLKDLDIIWEALHTYRYECIPEETNKNDDKWNDICTVMTWIQNELELGE